jgi:hypothetical protein
MYKIKILKFVNWSEYELKINNLFNEGYLIDETVEVKIYEFGLGQRHVIRFIKR